MREIKCKHMINEVVKTCDIGTQSEVVRTYVHLSLNRDHMQNVIDFNRANLREITFKGAHFLLALSREAREKGKNREKVT